MKAVLFDLDNTLLIKRPTIPEKWYEVLTENGFEISIADVERAFAACENWVGVQTQLENKTGIRMSDEDFLQNVIKCCVQELHICESAARLLSPVWIGDYPKEYELAPDATHVLKILSERGIELGIVSNNHSRIREVLNQMDILKYFCAVVISEEVNLYKPDPRILLYACEQMMIDPKDAIYVGDHPFDVVCAHEANMKAAWIPVNEFMKLPDGVAEPEMRLNRILELIF